MTGRIELDRTTYEAIVAHARSDAPYEVCGLLAGVDDRPVHHYRIPNASRSITNYAMDGQRLLQVVREMDDAEWDLLAIYHSHTHTEAFPSSTDVALAYYPEACYLIVSLQDEEPIIRGFDIVEGRITERTVLIDGEEAAVGCR